MKKFLSLVLALVMTMSLVTISAGAKDYADSKDITYNEAVDVLSALGVLEGDASGFRPTATLKRSEAAKIIAALNLTPKTAASLTADTAPFADVPASHWAAGYIADCVDAGILAGVGGGKFAPDAELTGYAYLKMLLVCLGYDAAIEQLTGANWTVNVAKLAKKVGLTEGNDDFTGTKAVTREEAALYALNALQADTVEYETKGTSITIGGVEIAAGASKAEVVKDKDGKAVKYMAENYSKLKKSTPNDAYGRPAVQWSYKGEKVGTYADEAVLSLTKATKAKDIKAALKAEGYEKYLNVDTDITDTTFAATKNGELVEFFGKEVTDEDTGKVTNVIYKVTTVETKLAKFDKVIKDKTSTKDIDEREIKLVGVSKAGLAAEDDDVVANFETLYDEVEKGDYILYTLSDDGKTIVTAEIAETIEGKITAVTSSKITVDGESYSISKNAGEFAASKDIQTIWLDSYGYAIKGEKTGSDDVDAVYLVKLFNSEDKYGTMTYYAQVVNAEGEIEELTLAAEQKVAEKKLYTYTTNSKGKATLAALEDEKFNALVVDSTIKADAAKVAGVYFADEVTFVYIEKSGADLKVTVSNKVDKVASVPANSFAVLDKDGKYVETVFIGAKAQAIVDSKDLVFVKSAKSVGTALDDEDAKGDTYEFYKDGDKMTEIASGIKGVGFYTYSVNSTTGRYTLEAADDAYSFSGKTDIAKDKYMTLYKADGSVFKTDVVLDADAEIYDLSDNNITSLGELSDLLDEDEKLTAHVVYDTKDEVVTLIYIV